MAMARYQASELGFTCLPGFRIAPDVDFFRGEAGLPWVPCILDDGDIFAQRMKSLKAFFDMTLMEAMVYVRWGATKFVLGQGRAATDNTYNASAEPSNDNWLWSQAQGSQERKRLQLSYFIDMITAAFPEKTQLASIMAILKRSTVIVNTKSYYYLRLAGMDSEVQRLHNTEHYITPEAGAALYKYKKFGTERDPATVAQLLQEETAQVSEFVKPAAIRDNGLVDVVPADEVPADEMDDIFGFGGGLDEEADQPIHPVEEGVAVKLEPEEEHATKRAKFKELFGTSGVIELDD